MSSSNSSNPLLHGLKRALRESECAFPVGFGGLAYEDDQKVSGSSYASLPACPLDSGGGAWPSHLEESPQWWGREGGGTSCVGEVEALGEAMGKLACHSAKLATSLPLTPSQKAIGMDWCEFHGSIETSMDSNSGCMSTTNFGGPPQDFMIPPLLTRLLDFLLGCVSAGLSGGDWDGDSEAEECVWGGDDGDDDDNGKGGGGKAKNEVSWGFTASLQLLSSLVILCGAFSTAGSTAALVRVKNTCTTAVLQAIGCLEKGRLMYSSSAAAFLTVFRLARVVGGCVAAEGSGDGGCKKSEVVEGPLFTAGGWSSTIMTLLRASLSPPCTSRERSLHENARWAAMASSLESAEACGYSPVPQGSNFCHLATTVCNALEVSSPEALPSILQCAAYVIRYIGNAATPATNAIGTPCTDAGTAATAVGQSSCSSDSGVVEDEWETLHAILSAMKSAVWSGENSSMSRRVIANYSCALLQPRASVGGEELLLQHVFNAVRVLGGEGKPSWALQILTARLVSLWSELLCIAATVEEGRDDDYSKRMRAASIRARSTLIQYAPVMLALALHKESLMADEDPLLLDSTARSLFFSWLAAREANAPGLDDPNAVQLQVEEEILGSSRPEGGAASMGEGVPRPAVVVQKLETPPRISEESLRQRFSQQAGKKAAAAGSISQELVMRGAGALTRLQVLCFLHELSSQTIPLARAKSPQAPFTLFLLHLHETLLFGLIKLLAKPSWLSEISPGTSMHTLRLRAWQTLVVLGAPWGQSGLGDQSSRYYSSMDAWVGVFDDDDDGDGDNLTQGHSSVHASIFAQAGLPPMRNFLRNPLQQQQQQQLPGVKGVGGVSTKRAVVKGGSICGSTESTLNELMIMEKGVGVENSRGIVRKEEGGRGSSREGRDEGVAAALLHLVFNVSLSVSQLPSTRHYMEALAVAISRRFPALSASNFLLPSLQNYSAKSQCVFSTLLVASHLVIHCATLSMGGVRDDVAAGPPLTLPADSPACPPTRALSLSLLRQILPWVSAPIGLSRLLAQTSLYEGFKILFPASGTTETTKFTAEIPELSWVAPLVSILHQCPDISEQREKCLVNLARVSPASSTSLSALLTHSPVSEHGEYLPRDTFSYISAIFRFHSALRHREDTSPLTRSDVLPPTLSASFAAGLLPPAALHYAPLRWPLGVGEDGGGMGVFGLCSPPPPPPSHKESNFQRKVGSAVCGSGSGGGGGGGGNTTENGTNSSDKDKNKSSSESRFLPAPHPLLNQFNSSGRGHQSLLICASLVDKPPNLGGLARTAEIFGAQALVIPESRVLTDPAFIATSLDAERLLPIHTVPPSQLLDYIRCQRALGWSVVALEQASRSVPLGSTQLPRKMLLVLGAEKEGLPVNVLSEVDLVLEIPQLGVLRSLNVHVSASLVMWEFVRQGLLACKGGDGEAVDGGLQ